MGSCIDTPIIEEPKFLRHAERHPVEFIYKPQLKSTVKKLIDDYLIYKQKYTNGNIKQLNYQIRALIKMMMKLVDLKMRVLLLDYKFQINETSSTPLELSNQKKR